MHIQGATPGSATWAVGETLLTGDGLSGSAAAAAETVGSAIVNGFDDSNAGALEALGGTIGVAVGGLAGAAIGATIGYAIAGLVGGANDNSETGSAPTIGNGPGSLAHGKPL